MSERKIDFKDESTPEWKFKVRRALATVALSAVAAGGMMGANALDERNERNAEKYNQTIEQLSGKVNDVTEFNKSNEAAQEAGASGNLDPPAIAVTPEEPQP